MTPSWGIETEHSFNNGTRNLFVPKLWHPLEGLRHTQLFISSAIRHGPKTMTPSWGIETIRAWLIPLFLLWSQNYDTLLRDWDKVQIDAYCIRHGPKTMTPSWGIETVSISGLYPRIWESQNYDTLLRDWDRIPSRWYSVFFYGPKTMTPSWGIETWRILLHAFYDSFVPKLWHPLEGLRHAITSHPSKLLVGPKTMTPSWGIETFLLSE